MLPGTILAIILIILLLGGFSGRFGGYGYGYGHGGVGVVGVPKQARPAALTLWQVSRRLGPWRMRRHRETYPRDP